MRDPDKIKEKAAEDPKPAPIGILLEIWIEIYAHLNRGSTFEFNISSL